MPSPKAGIPGGRNALVPEAFVRPQGASLLRSRERPALRRPMDSTGGVDDVEECDPVLVVTANSLGTGDGAAVGRR